MKLWKCQHPTMFLFPFNGITHIICTTLYIAWIYLSLSNLACCFRAVCVSDWLRHCCVQLLQIIAEDINFKLEKFSIYQTGHATLKIFVNISLTKLCLFNLLFQMLETVFISVRIKSYKLTCFQNHFVLSIQISLGFCCVIKSIYRFSYNVFKAVFLWVVKTSDCLEEDYLSKDREKNNL